MNGNKFATGQILEKPVGVAKGQILASWAQKSPEPCMKEEDIHALTYPVHGKMVSRSMITTPNGWDMPNNWAPVIRGQPMCSPIDRERHPSVFKIEVFNALQMQFGPSKYKVETPIHDSTREIGNMGVQRAWSEIMNVLAKAKGSVERWNLNFWRLEQFYTKF